MIFLATIQQLSERSQRLSRFYTRFSDYRRLSRKNWATFAATMTRRHPRREPPGTVREPTQKPPQNCAGIWTKPGSGAGWPPECSGTTQAEHGRTAPHSGPTRHEGASQYRDSTPTIKTHRGPLKCDLEQGAKKPAQPKPCGQKESRPGNRGGLSTGMSPV